MAFPKISYQIANPDKLASKIRLTIGKKTTDISAVEFKGFKAVADALDITIEEKIVSK